MAGVQKFLHRRGYLLALVVFDCASEWNTIPIQLNQRGIEGVIAIDAILPQELELPVASVELELSLPEPLDAALQAWLSELGETAAETVLRQIEKEAVPRRMKVVPKPSSAYFGLPNDPSGVEAR
jgi:DNA-binding LacI/PurR family transcriptional regulator